MKIIIILCLIFVELNSLAAKSIFNITPNIAGPNQLVQGQLGTYSYQITNNTEYNFTTIGLLNLPQGVTVVPDAGLQYCTFPLSLNSNASCLMKLSVDSNQVNSHFAGGPMVCYTPDQPVYCSQPLSNNQLSTQIIPGSVPTTCQGNEANFNYELSQRMDSSVIDHATIESWGPGRQHLLLSPANPNLTNCPTTTITNEASIRWMQTRVLAAEDFWVKQKLNYCHHHVVDFYTPLISNGVERTAITSGGGFCSTAADIHPGTVYYGQPVRWNYNGTGSETSENWNNNNVMWYGIDCSDFTSFVYNFAFGIQFNSDTGYQAGQATNGSQDLLTPNGQTKNNPLRAFNNKNPDSPAGVLVCNDGRTEVESPHCGGFGTNGYFSAFLDRDIHPTPSNITPAMLNLLQPGDLLFLAFAGKGGNNPTSMVTHVITWTGKKVGFGPNDVNPNQIAPESICPNNWQPEIGDWVIIDSHYQGPDYRVFSQCFYQNNIWGVRRVIGYMV